MEKDMTNIDITLEDLKELSPEELIELKLKLEELAMDYEELLEEDEE